MRIFGILMSLGLAMTPFENLSAKGVIPTTAKQKQEKNLMNNGMTASPSFKIPEPKPREKPYQISDGYRIKEDPEMAGLPLECRSLSPTEADYLKPDFIGCTSYRTDLDDFHRKKEKEKADAAKSKSTGDDRKKAEDAEKKIQEMALACDKEAAKAKSSCMGSEISPLVQGLATQFEQTRTSGDIAKACAAAKRLNSISIGANFSVGIMCHKAYPKCMTVCSSARSALATARRNLPGAQTNYFDVKDFESIDRNIQQCGQYKDNVGATYMQGLANVGGYAQSQQCLKAIAQNPTTVPAICEAANASENPLCIDKYCAVPGRENVLVCKNNVTEICADPAMAQNLFCRCKGGAASEDPACKIAGYTGGPPGEGSAGGGVGGIGGGGDDSVGGGVGSGTGPGSVGSNGGRIPDLPDLPPDPGQLAPLASNDGGGGGSGLPNFSGGAGVGGGGFSGSGGTPGKKSSGGDDEEESTGASVGGGGGQPDGPLANRGDGDGNSGGTVNGRGGGAGEENSNPMGGFDLSAFLPKDESRLPASGSSDLLQYGISDANGLSNWEKVTRKINEKRGELRN